jgi:uncharacterized protein (DUF2336 family)
MAVTASRIPELEHVIAHGSPERRAETLTRITALFLAGAGSFNDDHVQLFDEVLSRFVAEIEAKVRTDLSLSLAPVGNAPAEVVRRLATDDDIGVAGPVLAQSRRLAESDLVAVAETKSQAHLLAISTRRGIAEAVTDVLVRRGNRDVLHSVAENRDARLSDKSILALLDRAEKDDELAQKVGLRADIPTRLFRDLMLKATEGVQRRLVATGKPEPKSENRRGLANVNTACAMDCAREYGAAQREIEALRLQDKLDEEALVALARKGQFEETVAALASLCTVPIEVVDRLMADDRPDPVLILGRSAGWGWATVKAILMARSMARLGAAQMSSQDLDAACSNYERLSPTAARRVIRFWQLRGG